MLCSGVPHYQSVRPAPWTATSVTDQCPYSCNNLTETPLKAQLLCLTGTFSHQAASARFSKLLLSCDPHCSVVKFAFIIKIGNNNKHLGGENSLFMFFLYYGCFDVSGKGSCHEIFTWLGTNVRSLKFKWFLLPKLANCGRTYVSWVESSRTNPSHLTLFEML